MAEVIVAGGGAAGMMAAIRAAECGHHVTLLEQNEKLGKKLFITGKGRCNLTNSCDTSDFFDQVPRNASFLYSSIYTFDHDRTTAFFTEHGLKLKEERGGRIFPQSDHSSDVIRTLENVLKENHVTVRLHTRLTKILRKDGRITGVAVRAADAERGWEEKRRAYAESGREEKHRADALVLACGGCSYPSTGSDGSMFSLCRDLGHTVTELKPSLVPLTAQEAYIPELMGLSLRNVMLTIRKGKKLLYEGFGEMLFTHFGVSGPLVLSASSRILQEAFSAPLPAQIDLKPALDEEKLDRRLQRLFSEHANKQFKNFLGELLPAKMVPVMIRLSGIRPEQKGNSITREQREKLLGLLKGFPFTITGTGSFQEAIITRGGISVKEVDPSTMQSKLVDGLYFAGEMLDVDAVTGGFNLQIAWSTGYLAGDSIGQQLG